MANVIEQPDPLHALESRLEATRAQLRDLATMGAIITSIQPIRAVLSVVMEMAIRLVEGEVGLIMLDSNGELRTEISWGVDEAFARSMIYRDGMDLPGYCCAHRDTAVLNDLDLPAINGTRVRAIIAAPIQTANKCHGVMMIVNKSGGGSFAGEDRESLERLLSFAAVAIDNSILLKEQLARQRVDQEMAIARQIQSTILPQDIDSIQGADIGVAYYPAREVGGDFYDVIKIDDSQFVVVVGDVSNKGVPAALVMSAAAGIIKSIIRADPSIPISSLAVALNDILSEEIIKDREMFVTLFFSRFDLADRRLTFCNAGHLPGLFWDNQARKVCELAVGGSIVGQFPGVTFAHGERKLHSGDRLFLYTDGLTEAVDVQGRLFGRERAGKVFVDEIGLSPKRFCRTVKEWVDRFGDGAGDDTRDDFTVLQVRVD